MEYRLEYRLVSDTCSWPHLASPVNPSSLQRLSLYRASLQPSRPDF